MFQGIFRAVGKVLATDLVPQNLRASGIGWYSTTVGLLQLLASIVAGLLWDKAGHTTVFLYGAAFAVVGSIALLLLVQGKPANVESLSSSEVKALKSRNLVPPSESRFECPRP